ncbi:hypothetical protein P153DRAFT_368232 [Dothidotthia symphoricarpi CBS 119687]|uniref:Uncharacterized protein n=1 Tax=Dothidotthia symphoricarpi CBS 119687 TaxID=1392245 RepID=A0A6A6A8Z3_9PLEO|nr:uncharacterized protein P153DRAFT_368232 [Dothidotthia symphoricarpi CBS 119687]KAF2127655.1 hypothetical protein P153DRAFT_368232 [Dothidotthia symphoricarpi CBS 119687]
MAQETSHFHCSKVGILLGGVIIYWTLAEGKYVLPRLKFMLSSYQYLQDRTVYIQPHNQLTN